MISPKAAIDAPQHFVYVGVGVKGRMYLASFSFLEGNWYCPLPQKMMKRKLYMYDVSNFFANYFRGKQ